MEMSVRGLSAPMDQWENKSLKEFVQHLSKSTSFSLRSALQGLSTCA